MGGNNRFRLSDMIPNTWLFHKLKDMGRRRTRNQNSKKKKTPPPPTSSKSTSQTSSSSSTATATATATAIPPQESKTEQSHILISHQRKSYYFTRELTPPPPPPPPQSPNINPRASYNSSNSDIHFPESPRKSSKQRCRSSGTRRRNRGVTFCSSVSAGGCSCHASFEDSVWTKPGSTSEEYPISPLDSSSDLQSIFPELVSDHDNEHVMISCSTSCHCRGQSHIAIGMNEESSSTKLDETYTASELELRPIVTKKPTEITGEIIKDINEPEKQRSSPVRRLSASSPPGLRLRTNSPRIASRKIQAYARKSVPSSCRRNGKGRGLSESFAVVKSSVDPQRDFRESMVEMILENNLRASKDLEDLLACYLQLNSDDIMR